MDEEESATVIATVGKLLLCIENVIDDRKIVTITLSIRRI
jgi:hypothetical protein